MLVTNRPIEKRPIHPPVFQLHRQADEGQLQEDRSGATSPSPGEVARMYSAATDHMDLPHKSVAARFSAPLCKSPSSPL